MDLTAFVDVAIGVTLVYLGTSLVVTIVNEYVGQIFQLRAKQLAGDLTKLIDDGALLERLREYPALAPFFGNSRTASSYVDPKVLGRLLVSALHDPNRTLRQTIDGIANAALKEQLLSIHDGVKGDVEKLVAGIGDWADRSLTMMGEMFKRNMQLISFGVGLAVAVALNIDTFALVSHLYRDDAARASAVALAEKIVAEVDSDTVAGCTGEKLDEAQCASVKQLLGGLRGEGSLFGLPLGWRGWRAPSDLLGCLGLLAGWITTALSASLGAAFWFDLLNRLVNVRHGMKKPEVPAREGA
jgi:hypothetical protein